MVGRPDEVSQEVIATAPGGAVQPDDALDLAGQRARLEAHAFADPEGAGAQQHRAGDQVAAGVKHVDPLEGIAADGIVEDLFGSGVGRGRKLVR